MFTFADLKGFIIGLVGIALILTCWLILPIVLIDSFVLHQLVVSIPLGVVVCALITKGAFRLYIPRLEKYMHHEQIGNIELATVLISVLVWPLSLLLMLDFEVSCEIFEPPSQQ